MTSENSKGQSASSVEFGAAGSVDVVHGTEEARVLRSSLDVQQQEELNGSEERGKAGYDVIASLQGLPELARHLVNADYAAVTVLNSEGVVISMLYAGITPDQAKKIGAPPKGIGLLGRLGEQDGPLNLDKMSVHPNSAGFPANHPAMDALLGVRVSSSGESTANLYVANKPGNGGFSNSDQEKISALASYARIALDNSHLYEEEHRLRAAAEAAEQRLAAVIRGSAAGVVVKDADDGRFLEVSGEARSIAGIEFTELTHGEEHPFEKLYHHTDGTPMQPEEIPMNIALRDGVSAGPTEVVFVRPDGIRLPVLVSAAPVFDSYGILDSAICVFVDVTKLKELDRAKDDFLSMITHDLRTPLTTIKGMAAAALDAAQGPAIDRAISFLEPIDDEVDYLTELVSNLLDMTRIEAGGDVLECEICHLADIAQDSLARMVRTRDARGRDIHTNVPPDLPAIYADPGQIGRVLDNLVSNALKYSDDGIGVSAKKIPGANQIRVEVSDRGRGIPEDQQTAIFDRFARLKGSSARRQGSGLGLAICKSIIIAHSGQIGVESGGNGAVFWFTLPTDTGDGDVG